MILLKRVNKARFDGTYNIIIMSINLSIYLLIKVISKFLFLPSNSMLLKKYRNVN